MTRYILLLIASGVALSACASSSNVQRTTITETRGDELAKQEVAQRLKKADLEQQIAESAGLLGALQDAGELDGVFGSSGLDADMIGGVGGLIGAKGTTVGSGGLGSTGSGLGGGGTAASIGGMGTAGYGRATKKKPKSLKVDMTVGAPRLTSGKLDMKATKTYLKRHARRLRYCVEREAHRDGGAAGVTHHKTSLEVTVNKEGRVEKIKPLQTDLTPRSEKCVELTFKRLRLPKPEGAKARVVVELEFEVERTKDTTPSP